MSHLFKSEVSLVGTDSVRFVSLTGPSTGGLVLVNDNTFAVLAARHKTKSYIA
jgi:hypothetical protein